MYFNKQLNEMQYLQGQLHPGGIAQPTILVSGVPASKTFQVLASELVPSYDALEKTQTLPLKRHNGIEWQDNITDWALKQLKDPMAPP